MQWLGDFRRFIQGKQYVSKRWGIFDIRRGLSPKAEAVRNGVCFSSNSINHSKAFVSQINMGHTKHRTKADSVSDVAYR